MNYLLEKTKNFIFDFLKIFFKDTNFGLFFLLCFSVFFVISFLRISLGNRIKFSRFVFKNYCFTIMFLIFIIFLNKITNQKILFNNSEIVISLIIFSLLIFFFKILLDELKYGNLVEKLFIILTYFLIIFSDKTTKIFKAIILVPFFIESFYSYCKKDNNTVIVKKENNFKFEYKTDESAGIDLCSNEDCEILPGEIKKVSTAIFLEMPKNIFGQIFSRSGMSLKGIITLAGTIDSDYRGEIIIVLHNLSKEVFTIEKGMRIGQIIFLNIEKQTIKFSEKLNDSKRGSGGFGSTGIF